MLHEHKIPFIKKAIEELSTSIENCSLCPRECRINRKKGEKGFCGGGEKAVVYTAFIHKGEEPPLIGTTGSGTIFFSGCTLKCVYCQNYKFSHKIMGKELTAEELAKIMLNLQEKRACNINLVTPTHFLIPVLKSLHIAIERGLRIPIVYNTSGYEKQTVIALIKDIVDIFLIDLRYLTPDLSKKYSGVDNYPEVNQSVIRHLYEHTENIWCGDTLLKGLIIRHLVLPSYVEESKKVIKWIENNLPYAYVSIMFQYQPYYKANLFKEINRPLTEKEYLNIKDLLEHSRLEGWLQDYPPSEEMAGVYFDPLKSNFL